jgi:glycosyltransferase involved in cell wall biosynthesis
MLKSKNLPLISVGIPFHNAQYYLEYAIKSVLAQTYDNWELILVDDGSNDNSLKIAELYAEKDNRIRVISDGKNMKLPRRLNLIIQESKGSYIARMDADDIMHPERLEKQLSFLQENSDFDLLATGLVSIDNNNKVKGYRTVGLLYTDFSSIKTSYPILHPSVMARKSWFERNKYSEKFPRAEDFELWTRAIFNNDFKMAILPELLLYYREEGNLDINKILNSYNDVSRIYKLYHLNRKIDVVKLGIKTLIVKGLHYSGNLQRLANHRNTNFGQVEKTSYQNILDKLINLELVLC